MGMTIYNCTYGDCTRVFLDEALLVDHSEAVHTYGEIEQKVNLAIREVWGNEGSDLMPSKASYTWVNDITDTWVVFTLEMESGVKTVQVDYVLNADGSVDFGDPVQVERKTVYVPMSGGSAAEESAKLEEKKKKKKKSSADC